MAIGILSVFHVFVVLKETLIPHVGAMDRDLMDRQNIADKRGDSYTIFPLPGVMNLPHADRHYLRKYRAICNIKATQGHRLTSNEFYLPFEKRSVLLDRARETYLENSRGVDNNKSNLTIRNILKFDKNRQCPCLPQSVQVLNTGKSSKLFIW